MFRAGKDLEHEALARPGARPTDITGKPMRGFVWVSAEAADDENLEQRIALAERYVGSLPAKQRKVPPNRLAAARAAPGCAGR
jgi:hypothetical protein